MANGKWYESVQNIHTAAGRNVPADGRDSVVGLRSLSLAGGLGAAASRLSHDSDTHLLSRRQPGCDRVICHRSSGKTVRPDARAESDDLGQFVWQLADHSAIHARSE